MKSKAVVLKFGGSSVSEVKHWKTIIDQIAFYQNQKYQPIIVLSALKNVSNLLEALLHQASLGVHQQAIVHLKELHHTFCANLGINGESILQHLFLELTTECDRIAQVKSFTPKQHASLLSFGELLSTTIGASFLKLSSIECEWIDVRQLLVSVDKKQFDEWHHYTSAECQIDVDKTATYGNGSSVTAIVTQGFIARDIYGDTVLLGREGSDTSAAYLSAKFNAQKLEIWTDVPGVFSTNPRAVSTAIQLPYLTYQQARNLAHFGAKVLHPRALGPIEAFSIPAYVKSTSMPKEPGTLISNSLVSSPLSCPLLWAIANEPNVLLLGMGKEDMARFYQAKQSIQSLGYDVIVDSTMQLLKSDNDEYENSLFLICRYGNSDKPEPKEMVFTQMGFNHVISHLGLISILTQPVEKNKASEKLRSALYEEINHELNKNSLTSHTQDDNELTKQGLCIARAPLLIDDEIICLLIPSNRVSLLTAAIHQRLLQLTYELNDLENHQIKNDKEKLSTPLSANVYPKSWKDFIAE